jgi:hypothetical protein
MTNDEWNWNQPFVIRHSSFFRSNMRERENLFRRQEKNCATRLFTLLRLVRFCPHTQPRSCQVTEPLFD